MKEMKSPISVENRYLVRQSILLAIKDAGGEMSGSEANKLIRRYYDELGETPKGNSWESSMMKSLEKLGIIECNGSRSKLVYKLTKPINVACDVLAEKILGTTSPKKEQAKEQSAEEVKEEAHVEEHEKEDRKIRRSILENVFRIAREIKNSPEKMVSIENLSRIVTISNFNEKKFMAWKKVIESKSKIFIDCKLIPKTRGRGYNLMIKHADSLLIAIDEEAKKLYGVEFGGPEALGLVKKGTTTSAPVEPVRVQPQQTVTTRNEEEMPVLNQSLSEDEKRIAFYIGASLKENDFKSCGLDVVCHYLRECGFKDVTKQDVTMVAKRSRLFVIVQAGNAIRFAGDSENFWTVTKENYSPAKIQKLRPILVKMFNISEEVLARILKIDISRVTKMDTDTYMIQMNLYSRVEFIKLVNIRKKFRTGEFIYPVSEEAIDIIDRSIAQIKKEARMVYDNDVIYRLECQ